MSAGHFLTEQWAKWRDEEVKLTGVYSLEQSWWLLSPCVQRRHRSKVWGWSVSESTVLLTRLPDPSQWSCDSSADTHLTCHRSSGVETLFQEVLWDIFPVSAWCFSDLRFAGEGVANINCGIRFYPATFLMTTIENYEYKPQSYLPTKLSSFVY